LKKGNPKPIFKFPSPKEIGAIKEWNPDRDALVSEKVGTNYIVAVQMPDYAARPRWNGSIEKSKDFIWNNGLRFLRDYQLMQSALYNSQLRKEKTGFFLRWPPAPAKLLHQRL